MKSPLLTLAIVLCVVADVGLAVGQANPQLDVAQRAYAAKQAQIATSVVASCKSRVEEIVKPAEEHLTTCGCVNSEENLAALRRAEQQDLARCDLKGLDAQISYIDQREAAVRAGLRDMIGKFRRQASAFESWGSDAERGKREAQDKIDQILISQAAGEIVDHILGANEDRMTRRLDEVVKHAKLHDVRRVRTGELKDLVVAMREKLAGKSKAEAKQIVLRELTVAKLAVADAGFVEKRVTDSIIDTNIPRDDEPSAEEKTQSYLEGDYATLLTAIQIAANHGVKDAKIFANAAGVLAFAPDALDAAAILYNASAIGDNISGLDHLSTAAEQQRRALSAELTVLVAQRRKMTAERSGITEKSKL